MKRTKNGGIDRRFGARAGAGPRKAQYIHKPVRTASYLTRDLFGEIAEQHLTLRAVAERMGNHPVSLSYWKSGKHEMRAFDLENMAEVLGYRLVMVKL